VNARSAVWGFPKRPNLWGEKKSFLRNFSKNKLRENSISVQNLAEKESRVKKTEYQRNPVLVNVAGYKVRLNWTNAI
jgi:hypothetical protein